ncbi:gluconolactonase [Christiangramia fulva]|uniref:Gluconolactonase n=1 Tax=Christiangramia fulva TaxID=2126553 RepID=A0A2R3Z8T4_9FLAO|nr:SMP-30/gluconolactonase/LRE family protein [Christiangramia fulva]AVR46697.1 gluconolactonase [Christiangramia fulva]
MRKYILIEVFLLWITVSCNSHKKIIKEGAMPVLISEEFDFTEGPASDAKGNVYFTDQPNNQILKWSAETGNISVYMENAGRANGLYIDRNGNLLAAADEKSELWQIDPDKNVKVLVDNFQNKRLNGPNDLWVDSRGGIYFTDPYYQREYWKRQKPDIDQQRVYYLTPDKKEVKIVADDLVKPNGIIGSWQYGVLYISDIGAGKTYSYKISEDGNLIDKKLFAQMGSDGMTMDRKGNVYLTGDGVTVFNKEGKKITYIPIDRDWTANVTFGGKDHDKLFITASEVVYILDMNVKGNRWN